MKNDLSRFSHVLLVDDNEVDNYINSTILKRCNFADVISSRQSARDALEYLRTLEQKPEEVPAIIFLDIRMPVMDGFGFLDQFGTLPEVVRQRVKIIMLSSSIDPVDKERSLKYSHVVQFMKKPLDTLALLPLEKKSVNSTQ